MRIGELAERIGVSTRALRHYESRGLLPARRTSNGYREYDEADVRVAQEIRALLGIGFGLEETRPFVECLQAGHDTGDACPASVAVYRRKVAEIDGYLARLGAVRDQLTAAIARVTGPGGVPPVPQCDLTPAS
jgi:DNA-binding transcriptional MerR regulator